MYMCVCICHSAAVEFSKWTPVPYIINEFTYAQGKMLPMYTMSMIAVSERVTSLDEANDEE